MGSGVGACVGAGVGFGVGAWVGLGVAVGFTVGLVVGFAVGLAVGFTVGVAVGLAVGFAVGVGEADAEGDGEAFSGREEPGSPAGELQAEHIKRQSINPSRTNKKRFIMNHSHHSNMNSLPIILHLCLRIKGKHKRGQILRACTAYLLYSFIKSAVGQQRARHVRRARARVRLFLAL